MGIFPGQGPPATYQHVGGDQPVCIWWVLQVLGDSTTGSGHPGFKMIISQCHNVQWFNVGMTGFANFWLIWILCGHFPKLSKVNILRNLKWSFWSLRHWWLFCHFTGSSVAMGSLPCRGPLVPNSSVNTTHDPHSRVHFPNAAHPCLAIRANWCWSDLGNSGAEIAWGSLGSIAPTRSCKDPLGV